MSDLENFYEVHFRPPEFIPCILSPPLSWQGSDNGEAQKSIKPFKWSNPENSMEFQKTNIFDQADN